MFAYEIVNGGVRIKLIEFLEFLVVEVSSEH